MQDSDLCIKCILREGGGGLALGSVRAALLLDEPLTPTQKQGPPLPRISYKHQRHNSRNFPMIRHRGASGRTQDLETHELNDSNLGISPDVGQAEVNISPFVGRVGGGGTGCLTRNSSNEELLKALPDAAPLMSLSEQFSLRPFLTAGLWKAALMEGVGKPMPARDRAAPASH